MLEEDKARVAVTLGFVKRPHAIKPHWVWVDPSGKDIGGYLPQSTVEEWAMKLSPEHVPTVH